MTRSLGPEIRLILPPVVRLTYRLRTVFVTMELRYLRYLVVVAFIALSTAMAKAASAIKQLLRIRRPIFTIVGRKGKSSVGIDRLPCYVDCTLRSQESEDAGDLLSAGRFSYGDVAFCVRPLLWIIGPTLVAVE
jgi:hypothetical protein